MFAPLSEHIENKLDESFCHAYRVYGTYDKPNEWEDYKECFAEYLIEEFIGEKLPPPKSRDWQ